MYAVDGGKVRQLRSDRGWSLQDLVFHARTKGFRLHPSSVSNLENNKREDVFAQTLKAIAETLEVSMDELMCETENVETV